MNLDFAQNLGLRAPFIFHVPNASAAQHEAPTRITRTMIRMSER